MSSIVLLILAVSVAPPDGSSWTGFRGDGTNTTAAGRLPVTWSAFENIAWRASLPGYGQSSPVIWNGKVFLTAVDGQEKESCLVVAIDLAEGATLWKKAFAASRKGPNNPSMSRGAPTPVVDAQGVYVFFESGDLVGLNHRGEVTWKRSLADEYGDFKNHHGLSSSLAQTEKAVFVLIEHGGPSYLLAVDKQTGKNLWKVERKSRLSWTTPIVLKRQDRELVLVSSSGSLTCYDADTGRAFWSYDDLSGNLIPSPVAIDDMVIVGAGESGLTSDMKAAARSNCCLKLVDEKDGPSYRLLWQGRKAVAHHASPLVHRNHVYLVTKVGVVYCYDLATGEERYSARLESPCWATPLGAGDHVYFFGKDGATTVIKAGSEYRQIAVNRLWTKEDLAVRAREAERRPENKFPPLPKQGRKEMEAMLRDAVGEVVYGAGVVDGTIVLRTGTELYALRTMP